MKVIKKIFLVVVALSLIILPSNLGAQDAPQVTDEVSYPEIKPLAQVSQIQPGNITLDFADVDMQEVLRVFAYKAGVNIIAGPEVSGPVRVRLEDVPWQDALEVILKTYDYAYEKKGNVIVVSPINILTAKKEAEAKLASTIPLLTEVITLKYIDAEDAKKALEPQLSSRGKITTVKMRGQKGWAFGSASSSGGSSGSAGSMAALEREKNMEKIEVRSKIIVISDVPDYMRKLRDIITQIDTKPRQVMINVRIVEINRDRLRDIGFSWGKGPAGATGTTETGSISSHILESQLKPASFLPKATAMSGINPYTTGFSLLYKKMTGEEFEILVHALEEDVRANVLSAPRIVTLDNQEATILVGKKYPILKSDVTGTTTTTVTASLDYYQDIGIQLNVVPQISDDKYINMIVHPAVTDFTETVTTFGSANQTVASYPIILTREAETQIIMEDGDTVVIGGLLKDVKNKSQFKVPILADIPFLGRFFTRDTVDTEKIDLLIFITARIVDEKGETQEALKGQTSIGLAGGTIPPEEDVSIKTKAR